MKTSSGDKEFTKYDTILREKLDILAKKIEPKVYEHGFLLE